MNSKARLGRWVLVAVIVVIVLAELTLAGLSLQAGRFRGSQIGRVLLTGWLLWRVWDGASWARWVAVALFLATAVFAVGIGVASPAVQQRPEVVALLAASGAVCLAFGVGLASPWVGAYQSVRRRSPEAEPVAPPATGRSLDSSGGHSGDSLSEAAAPPRLKLIALLCGLLLIGVLAAINLGVLEKWVIEPREARERKRQQVEAAYWAEIQRLDEKYQAELEGKDEQAVIDRLGPPTEKIDRVFASTGRNHPLWRYTSPPLEISFNEGVVEIVHYQASGPPSD